MGEEKIPHRKEENPRKTKQLKLDQLANPSWEKRKSHTEKKKTPENLNN